MTLLRQSLALSAMALRSLPQRLWPSLVIVMSMGCVVGVLLSMLSETAGLLRAYETGGDPSRAVVISANAFGTLSRNDVATILDAPGIARAGDGTPVADAEIQMWIPPTKGYTINSPELRGLGAAGLALRPGFRIVSGRAYRPGTQELIVGLKAQRAFGLKVGDRVILPNGEWPIVGAFSAAGGILEGQLAGDAETLLSASRISSFGSVLVQLQGPTAFDSFKRWLTGNPSLGVTAERQSDYDVRTANRFAAFFTKVAYAIGIVMALGALFGSVKILYATVSSRTREIGTLRALGYAPVSVAASVIAETVVLALAGSFVGAFLAWLLFSGQIIADNQNVFEATMTLRLLLLGVGWAAGIAILGSLAPAIRAARLSVSEALRTA